MVAQLEAAVGPMLSIRSSNLPGDYLLVCPEPGGLLPEALAAAVAPEWETAAVAVEQGCFEWQLIVLCFDCYCYTDLVQ